MPMISQEHGSLQKKGEEHVMIDKADTDYPFTPLKHRESYSFGDSQMKTLHAPGHTGESTSFMIDGKALLTGDTLFRDGVGRPDLKADKAVAVMKAEQLYESLQTILSLPKTTILLPAHILRPVAFDNTLIQSTLSDLKSEMELLQLSKSDFIKATLERIPEPPENYLTIAGLNKKGSYKEINAPDFETGANRCAVS